MQKRLWLFLLALSACAALPPAEEIRLDSRPAIIFIPGYYGTNLKVKETGERVFLTPKEIFLSNNSFGLYQKELGTPYGPELEIDGIWEEFRLGLMHEDVYATTLSYLRRDPATQVIPFAYDWRRDISENAGKLGQLVDELRKLHVPRIDIVAHSMGGLVASYYAGYGSQDPERASLTWEGAKKIRRVVFLGTPFRGVFSIFRNINQGAKFEWNKHLLPMEAVASFPGSFQLLPFAKARILDLKGNPVPFKMENFAFWKEHNLSLLGDESVSPEVKSNRLAFVEKQLARAFAFSTLLQFPGAAKNPPPASLRLLTVVGTGRKTVDSAYFDGKEFYFDTDGLSGFSLRTGPLKADGDSVVTAASAEIPEALAIRAVRFETKRGHGGLQKDGDVLNFVYQFIWAP